MKGLFIFRRDLRYQDNVGLYNACAECDEVICLFVITPKQSQPKLNPYFSYNAFAFMLECLVELKTHINVLVEYNEPSAAIKKIVTEYDISTVYLNRDYTPYAVERDRAIAEHIKIPVKTYDDIALNNPDNIKPYKVFTPYYNVAKKVKISSTPLKPNIGKIKTVKHKSVDLVALLAKINKNTAPLRQVGGRAEAEKTLKKLAAGQKSYATSRNDLSKETSRLSPYIKFGVLGIREVYRYSPNPTFKKELFWRDFYIQIAYHFPNVLTDTKATPIVGSKVTPGSLTYNIDKNFKKMKIKWSYSDKLYNAFVQGKTGIPVVDAAVKQLLQTGYMHNRCRMITASVFTKLFHLDWRLGEKFFANHLTDYDPCSNNGGWQWASGTGADSQPYFRIFNPYVQAENHDSDCTYVKKWCHELKDLSPKEIFALRSDLFDYEKERKVSIERFSKK